MMLSTRTHNLTFDLTLLTSHAKDEESYWFSKWLVLDFLQSIDIFTDKEKETYTNRFNQLFMAYPSYKFLPALLNLDTEDLNDLLEEPPLKMKRYQRMDFCNAIQQVHSGERTPAPAPSVSSMTEQERVEQSLRAQLCVPIEFFVEERKGMHQSQWPMIRERKECHIIVWYMLCNQIRFQNKTVLELGAGALGVASLALAQMNVAKQIVVTEGTEDQDKLELLRHNGNTNRGSNTNVSVEHFEWENKSKMIQIMENVCGNYETDIIIGCDILNYTLNMPIVLLNAVYALMTRSTAARTDCIFYCAHNLRFGLSHLGSIERYAEELGMIMKRIDPFDAKTGFVPMDVKGKVVPDVVKEFDKTNDVVLLSFQLKYPN